MTTTDIGGAAAQQLLATKLHAPRRRGEIVRRTRLTDRLSPTHHPALTLVSAPAGFGKTTLLADWFEHVRTSTTSATAWLTLDERDNDPATFGRYLVAAVRAAVPELGLRLPTLLQTGEPLHVVVEALVNDLSASDADVTLVLDDYHAIETAGIHDAMSLLVEQAPRRFRLVLATRADPPLPLARWRAGADLLEIRAADLRFSGDEAVAYMNEAMGLPLAERDIGVLETRTEGWIAALQLAALSLRGRNDPTEFIDSFAGDDRFVLDYLTDEVLERQSAEIRSFLLQTSVLDRMNGSLCDAVTQRAGGKSTLELLDRANLFLVALDDRRHWYRYHHLFADVLRSRLLDEGPDASGELHRRASDWFDEHHDPTEAIRHSFAANDPDRAARQVELAAPMMRRTRQEATLRRWLEALPAALFERRPVLAIALVGARMATGDTSGIEQLLDDAQRWIERSPSADTDAAPIVFDRDEYAALPAQIAVYRAGLALLAGDTAGTIAHATRAVELARPGDHLRLGAAAALTGLAHWTRGDLDEASRRYADAIAELRKGGFVSDVLGLSLGLADIQIAQGRLRSARLTYESALSYAAQHPVMRGTADMHVGLSEVAIEQNDLAGAAAHLDIACELGEHAGLPQHPYRWRVATALLRQAQGDLDDAIEPLDDARQVYNTDFSPSVRPIAALRARLDLRRGDPRAASAWSIERGLDPDDDLSYVSEFEHITLARTLLAGRDTRPDAIALLKRLLVAAEAGGRNGAVIEMLVLLATAHEADGDRPAAIDALERALALAEPEGYVRVFLDLTPELLRAVPRISDRSRHTRVVLAAADDHHRPAQVAGATNGSVEALSSRELDVLRLLRSELAGPGIARELHISLNTLRTHTKNIYAKLGATNRREAIRAASERGL